jgi:hypothetical protein
VLGVNNFFHLSDFDNKKFNTKKEYKTISKYAIKGDIIISRIGKRSLGKITYIETGSIEISDCVFVIRIESHYRKSVLKALKSKYGKDWVKAKAHGVCSQFITKSDLLSFKVPGT